LEFPTRVVIKCRWCDLQFVYVGITKAITMA